ncbi:hypothetical protein EYR38_007303 [Pleurotus pulmonarius]|nr:hypothetical protein EYR38_007303 [Pleurotus pulmonarius]
MSVNVPKILNHLDQLKGIELYGCEPDWSGRIISQGAPQLESLSLRSLSFNNYGEIETFHLPVNAFPVLQHLELFGFIYTSSVASLTTLRSLTINPGGNIPKSHLPSSVEFLAILASLPNLSELSLTKALAPSVGPLPSSSVMLTHLTRLYIMDDILNIGIMACITAPQLKAIDLHHQYGDTSAEIATAVAVVAAIFRKLPTFTTSCSELSLSVTDSSFAGVKLWDDCTTCEIAKREPFFKMLIHGAGDLRVEESFLTLFPPTTCPPTLYLEFRVDTASHCAQYARLQHILRQLTHVTEVRTSNCKTLINVLDDTHPTISLPSLKEIGPTINSGSCKRLWPKLVEQLKVRKELHDVEIEKLVILDIYNLLTSADLKPFEGLVKVSKRKSELNYQPIFF